MVPEGDLESDDEDIDREGGAPLGIVTKKSKKKKEKKLKAGGGDSDRNKKGAGGKSDDNAEYSLNTVFRSM